VERVQRPHHPADFDYANDERKEQGSDKGKFYGGSAASRGQKAAQRSPIGAAAAGLRP
jgi:hypothetical protein